MKYCEEKIKNGPNQKWHQWQHFTILRYANELLVNHNLVI